MVIFLIFFVVVMFIAPEIIKLKIFLIKQVKKKFIDSSHSATTWLKVEFAYIRFKIIDPSVYVQQQLDKCKCTVVDIQ